jgi:hypothetical protein
MVMVFSPKGALGVEPWAAAHGSGMVQVMVN